jgi:hypothetical protein
MSMSTAPIIPLNNKELLNYFFTSSKQIGKYIIYKTYFAINLISRHIEY